MTATLLEQHKTRAAQQRADWWSELRDILSRADAPSKGDGKALEVLVGKAASLGIDVPPLDALASVVKQAADLDAQAAEADSPKLQAERESAGKVCGDYQRESERLANERYAEGQRLLGVVSTLDNKLDQARRAKGELRKLRQAHHELFGVPPAQPVAATQPSCVVDFSHLPRVTRHDPLTRVFQGLPPGPQGERRYPVDPETLAGVQRELAKLEK